MLINCSECQKEISDNAGKCPHCGNPISKKKEGLAKKESKGCLRVLIVLLALGGLVSLFGNNDKKPPQITNQINKVENTNTLLDNVKLVYSPKNVVGGYIEFFLYSGSEDIKKISTLVRKVSQKNSSFTIYNNKEALDLDYIAFSNSWLELNRKVYDKGYNPIDVKIINTNKENCRNFVNKHIIARGFNDKEDIFLS